MEECIDGAFDVTIQPLWDVRSRAKSTGALPECSAVSAARELVDFRRLELADGGVRLRGDGGAVTLNGLA